ncbi:hypothetical protein A1D31_35945 [Bradyrhizobium liaoningense]|nr:hypothetical protein A1D31_35945 [Bradyrhizobium liaoningense]
MQAQNRALFWQPFSIDCMSNWRALELIASEHEYAVGLLGKEKAHMSVRIRSDVAEDDEIARPGTDCFGCPFAK